MKKSLLFIFALMMSVGAYNAFGQACSPDPQYTSPGIYPDSATGIPPAYVDSSYSALVTEVVPTDTNVIVGGFPVTVTIDSITLDTLVGLPPSGNFSYATNPASGGYPGGTSGCLIITGIPTVADTGTWPLVARLTDYTNYGSQPDSVTYYKLVVHPAVTTGIAEAISANRFDISQNMPNPFSTKTKFVFSSPQAATVKLHIYDMLGKLVYRHSIDAHKGYNEYTYNSTNLPAGVYMYSLSNGQKTMFKKMVITK